MATLEKLRKRGKLIAIVVAFALFAFILGDLLSNITSISGGDRNQIALINGKEATIEEFQARFTEVKEIYEYLGNTVDGKMQETIENQVWEQILTDRLLADYYTDLGIDISDEEIGALVTGTNVDVDPTIRQYFSNRQTGEYFQDAAVDFFKTMDQDPGKQRLGLFLEKEVVMNRKFTKYQTLISKGLNVTSAEAEDLYRERTHMVDFEYVMKKYAAIPDSTLKIEDSEIKAYYNAHQNKYKQKESRDIAYVTFDIIPSEKDKAETLEAANEFLEEFKSIKADSASENIFTFANANSDVPVNRNFLSINDCKQIGLDSAFFTAATGTVVGPFEHAGFYKIARLIAKKSLSDTVDARHILLSVDGQKFADMPAAQKFADSLLLILKNGKADFADLVKKHSADPGSVEKGGLYEKITQGQMVPEFNDAVFNNPKGWLGSVETQFGIHIIEVMRQSAKSEKIQIASLEKKIGNVDASEKLYQKTKLFAGNNDTYEKFEAALAKEGLTKKVAKDVTPQTKVVAGFSDASQIINWAYRKTSEVGMVSQDDIVIDDKYVVIALTAVKEEGIAPIEQVKDQITAELAKQKKAEIFSKELTAALSGGKAFADIAKEITGESGAEKNKSFSATRMRLGDEQAVVANAVKMEKDTQSAPIAGEVGVYVIKVTSVTGVAEVTPELTANDKQTAQNRILNRSRNAYNALKEAAEIKDNRHLFF